MNIITPEEAFRRLAVEMIIANLHGLCFFEHNQRLSHIEREHCAALDWFNRRDANFPGYGWALGFSGLNPNAIRRIIEAQCRKYERAKSLYVAQPTRRRKNIFRLKYFAGQTLKILEKCHCARSTQIAASLRLNPVTTQKIGRFLAQNHQIIIRRDGSRPAIWELI